LSGGITKSLIANLTHVPELKMKSRNSVFRYKGKDVDVQKVDNELGVSALVSGRVTPHGDNVEVSAELTDVRDNTEIWGQHYSGKSTDIIGHAHAASFVESPPANQSRRERSGCQPRLSVPERDAEILCELFQIGASGSVACTLLQRQKFSPQPNCIEGWQRNSGPIPTVLFRESSINPGNEVPSRCQAQRDNECYGDLAPV
jgi:hypothetical protein